MWTNKLVKKSLGVLHFYTLFSKGSRKFFAFISSQGKFFLTSILLLRKRKVNHLVQAVASKPSLSNRTFEFWVFLNSTAPLYIRSDYSSSSAY